MLLQRFLAGGGRNRLRMELFELFESRSAIVLAVKYKITLQQAFVRRLYILSSVSNEGAFLPRSTRRLQFSRSHKSLQARFAVLARLQLAVDEPPTPVNRCSFDGHIDQSLFSTITLPTANR